MQFRVMKGSGNTLALYSYPLNQNVPPLIFGGSQGIMVPIFLEYVGQLCAVTVSETAPFHLEHVSGGPMKRYLIEGMRQPKRAQLSVGRLASDWTDVPIVDTGFQWLGDQQRVELSWISLDRLLHQAIDESVVLMSITLSLGTECVLGVLEEIVRNDELENGAEEIVEAILKLDVSQSALSQSAPSILALIPQVIATAKRHLTQLDDALREMAAAQEAAKQQYENNCAVIVRQRMRREALGFLYEKWKQRHGLPE